MFDAKDKAILEATALIGYINSLSKIGKIESERLEPWFEGLIYHSQKTGNAIDVIFNKPPVTLPDE